MPVFIFILMSIQVTEILSVHAQHPTSDHGASSAATAVPEYQDLTCGDGWEGSAQGIGVRFSYIPNRPTDQDGA